MRNGEDPPDNSTFEIDDGAVQSVGGSLTGVQRILHVVFLIALVAGCSTQGADPQPSTTAGSATTGGTTDTTGPAQVADPGQAADSPSTTDPAVAYDPELVTATCEALRTERAPGRIAALDEWDSANQSISFADRKDPLLAACGPVLENHLGAESLARRSLEFGSVGYVGGRSGCAESPATGTVISLNDSSVDVIAAVHSSSGENLDGWGYKLEQGLAPGEERQVSIPWVVPRSEPACAMSTRAWLVDTSPTTATLHEEGDTPESEIPAGAPPLATSGDDWVEILNSLIQFQYWVEAQPDPAYLEEYEDVRSGGLAEARADLENMMSRGVRIVRSGFDVLSVEVLEQPDANTVILAFHMGPGTREVHSSDGTVEVFDDGPQSGLGAFRRSEYDGRWRWLTLGIPIEE